MNNLIPYQKHINIIKDFKESFIRYSSDNIPKNEKQNLRSKLNLMSAETENAVHKAGLSTKLVYAPPERISGIRGEIDIFLTLFELSRYEYSDSMLIDLLEKAIGKLKFLQKQLLLILINPLRWIGEFIRIPFHLAGWAGFNKIKMEYSFLGKSIKFIISSIMFLAAVCTLLNYLGFGFETIVNVFRSK